MNGRIQLRPITDHDADVPSVGTGREQVALEVDGVPELRGNRSRVVLIASHLDAVLARLVGKPLLIVLQQAVAPWQRAELSWRASSTGVLLQLEHFGGLMLEGLRTDSEPLGMERNLPLSKGRELKIVLRNPSGAQLRAVAVLLVDDINPK
jgi:hypothetical protein